MSTQPDRFLRKLSSALMKGAHSVTHGRRRGDPRTPDDHFIRLEAINYSSRGSQVLVVDVSGPSHAAIKNMMRQQLTDLRDSVDAMIEALDKVKL